MLEKFCVGLVRILLGGILFFLTLLSAVVTCRVYGGSEIVQYGRDSLFLHLFFGAGVIGLTVFYRRRKERKCRKNQWLLLAAAAYLFWILLVPSWGGSDSHQCMASAQGLLQGDFSAWEPVAYSYGTAEGPLGYAYTYPSQNGLILYMAVLAFFFGDAAYVVFQILNIGFFILGIVSLQRMTVWGNERCSLLLWMACCLPFSFYILFVYGTMPGFGLSCLAMERLVRYVEEGRGRDFWIGAAAVAAAVILKSNYEIVLVALFLYLASSGVFRRKARLLVAAVLLITVYVIGNRGIQTGIFFCDRTHGIGRCADDCLGADGTGGEQTWTGLVQWLSGKTLSEGRWGCGSGGRMGAGRFAENDFRYGRGTGESR